ncbi:MAG TPA: DUF4157 domain-containing protein [Acidimicrobiales bacterium]|nr:DUF4157 domain-containing protein [Acidimicrobiales bacterium]
MVHRLPPDQIARFDHVPAALTEGVRIVEVPFLTPGADAMTLGRVVLVRRGHGDSSRLMAHELVHVQQWSRHGVVGFLRRYLGAYARNMARLRSHRSAYLAIPLEVEAREGARRWQETHPDEV